MSRLGELAFEESYLPMHKGCYTEGMWHEGGRIVVNVQPHVVDTVIHEVLHEMFQQYSERAICSLTGKLMKQLSEDEIQAVYNAYRRKVDGDT
jgi:hypothetical protein